jgi:Lrp/AsnC family transcriptional regulator, leucine-responsive regulatory protein
MLLENSISSPFLRRKTNMELDRLDLMILSELVKNARRSQVELAERVGLSTTAVARRQKALEDSGVIKAYHAVLDMGLFGYAITVLVSIALDSQSDEAVKSFEAGVAKCPSITRCFFMSGTDDYLAVVLAKDIQDFERIHRTELSRLPRVARIQSSFAIREIINRPAPLIAFASIAASQTKRT